MKVFSNQRSKREHIKTLHSGSILEKIITIEEFKKRILIVEDYKNISELEREILFNITFREIQGDKVLHIDKNLLNFLAYSQNFFSFFKELALEEINIKDLESADYYLDFKKHIRFLSDLREKYNKKITELKLVDEIFIPELYKINFNYLKTIDKIEVFIDGQISKFDIKIFLEIAKIVDFQLIFSRSNFYNRIDSFLNNKLEPDIRYSVNISTGEIKELRKLQFSKNIQIFGFKHRFSQIGFVKERIYYFNKRHNISLERIAVVLLDENFSISLYNFLQKNNKALLNFAMGLPINDTIFWHKIHTIYNFLNKPELEENKIRINKFIAQYGEYFSNVLELFKNNWNRQNMISVLRDGIQILLQNSKLNDKTSMRIIELLSEFYNSQYISDLEFKILFTMFYRRLEKIRIIDIQGGSVTALGLLETRGISFDAVIVLDFNDEVFPKQEEKDLFINSELRRDVGLPLKTDREGLQKLYLQQLLQTSEHVSISYINNDNTKISRFFHDFNLTIENYNENYENNLIEININKKLDNQVYVPWQNEISRKFKFSDSSISNHKFTHFFDCRRRFFYKYILKITEHDLFKSEHLTMGINFHEIMKILFGHKKYSSQDELKKQIDLILESKDLFSFNDFDRKSNQNILYKIIDLEMNNFQLDNLETVATELSLSVENYRGFKLEGKIDRLIRRKNDGSHIVIDYKTGNSNINNDNYQLIFYYILLRENGYKIYIEDLYFYLIIEQKLHKNSALINDLNDKLDLLYKYNDEEISFFKKEKCDKEFCNYRLLCQ